MMARITVPLLSVALLSACVVTVTAVQTLTCTTRDNPYVEGEFKATLVVVECTSSEDLYVTGNGGTGPWKSDLTSAQITDAGVAEAQNWMKHKTVSNGGTFPGPSVMWVGNFVIKCGTIELKSTSPSDFPSNYLFIPPPYPEPIDQLMAAFGATVPAGAPVTRKVAGVFSTRENGKGSTIPALTITAAQWDACLAAGTATFGFTGEEQDASGVALAYTFTDNLKAVIPATVVGVITKEELGSKCTAEAAAAVAKDLDDLMAGLGAVTSMATLHAKKASVNGLKSRRNYAQCMDLLEGMYDVTEETVSLLATKACTVPNTDAAWATDPCCNPVMQWSQCCAPRDKDVLAKKCANTNGVCNVNTAAMSTCEANYSSIVETTIQNIVGPAVLETDHPELGCDIQAKSLADEDQFSRFYDWAQTCSNQVTGGQTKEGRSECATDTDCWSKCDGTKCARLAGDAVIEPTFRCMLANTVDDPIQQHIGVELGFDPAIITSTTSGANVDFIAALAKFKTNIAEENCASATGVDDWCTNSLTKEQCEKIAVTNADLSDSTLNSGYTRVKWIDDPTSDDASVGWCKQDFNYMKCTSGPNDCTSKGWGECECGWGREFFSSAAAAAQAACTAATSTLNGCVANAAVGTLSSADVQLDESACTGASGTWVNYGAGTFHRLKTNRNWIKDPETNEYSKAEEIGDQAKCEAEKGCNWDAWGNNGGTTEALCMGRAGVAGAGDNAGEKMFCAKCSTPSDCDERMSMGTCVVRPQAAHDSATCLTEVGTSLGNPTWVSDYYWKSPWTKDYGCIRTTGFDTLETCLLPTICPTPVPDASGNVFGDCSSSCACSFCYDTTPANQADCEAVPSASGASQGLWKPLFKAGAGLCVFPALDTKAKCEAGLSSYKHWEGRGWAEGILDTEAKCTTGFCDDGKTGQDQQTTCDGSKQCTKRCKLCVTYMSDNSKNRMCYDSSKDSTACTVAGYEWDAVAEKCKKTDFTGDAAACSALGANHVYKDCNSFDKAQCTSGCHLTEFVTSDTCQSASGLSECYAEWNYGKCLAKGFWASYTANRQGYPNTDECAAAGAGAPEFLADADTNLEDYKLMSSMQCYWSDWAECPTEETCEAVGDCDDWVLQDGSATSSCVKSIERWETDVTETQGSTTYTVAKAGDRKWCSQDYDPPLAYGGRFGCIARTIETEAACTAAGAGYSWMTRASEEATCTGHGGTCMNKYKDSVPYGGIATKAECEACGDVHKWTPAAEWTKGAWQESSMFTGDWKARAWASKNSWVTTVVHDKLFDFARGLASRYFGQVYAQQIRCKLGPLVEPLKVIGCGCGAGAAPASCTAVFDNLPSVTLVQSTVFCSSMSDTPPLNIAAGSIIYTGNSRCGFDTTLGSEIISRVAIPDATVAGSTAGGRLLAAMPTKCDKHKVIKYWNGKVAGQKMGTALSTQMSNVRLCINTNVPASEICDEYMVLDFALVHLNGTITPPLQLEVAVDAQGRYCATTTIAGAYLPIKSEEPPPSVNETETTGDNSALVSHSCRTEAAAVALMVVALMCA